MGELNLNNIKCEDDGVLEIVNRSFAPISNNSYSMFFKKASDAAEYAQAYFPRQLSGDVHGMLGTLSSTSAISVSSCTSSLINIGGDGLAYARNFILPGRAALNSADWEDIIGYSYVGINDGSTRYREPGGGNPKVLDANCVRHVVNAGVNSVVADASILGWDLSTTQEYSSSDAKIYPVQWADKQLGRGIWAGNSFSKVAVQNSDGPIYIRGFIVDGSGGTTTGFDVNNTTNLTLEDCGAMRCKQSGFSINNSTINLRRQAVAARNYDIDNRQDATGSVSSTYGFKIKNSEVTFVTDSFNNGNTATFASHFHTYGIYLDNSVLKGGDKITSTQLTDSFYTDLGFNDVGLYCSNSKYSMDGVTTSYNNRINIEAKDSVLEVEQLRNLYAQTYGLLMDNSIFRYNKNLNSSVPGIMTTRKNTRAPKSHNYPVMFSYNGQHVVLRGGSTYSPTYPAGASGIDMTTLYNQEIYYKNHGRTYNSNPAADSAMKPGVVVENSVGEFTCAKFVTGAMGSYNDKAVPRHLLVTDNGTAIVRGLTNTGAGTNTACYFDGPKVTNSTAVIADHNSLVHFTGPVAIYNHGYGAVALNGSQIKSSPPLDRSQSYIDTIPSTGEPLQFSGWGGGLYKATPLLEIHSQGACLLADNKSTITLEDLGYYPDLWHQNPTLVTAADYQFGSTDFTNLITSGGVQFLPNEQKDVAAMRATIPGEGDAGTAYYGFRGISVADALEYTNYLQTDSTLSSYKLLYANTYGGPVGTTAANFLKVTNGGMCVKASNDSSVKVRNVHFPMGGPNADGSYYDASSSPAGCDNLMIWNIADISQLHASYCSVSGVYPSETGYTGPKAWYSSGTVYTGGAMPNVNASTLNFKVASGTPDTGTISVLDHFGSGVHFINGGDLGIGGLSSYMSAIQVRRTGIGASASYGESKYQNRGPFRLFFSVLPAAKLLSYASGFGDDRTSNSDTLPYQHLSQGYLLSGDCSGPAEFSGLYPQLLNRRLFDLSGVIATSGYYYPSALMPPDRADVWVDESAANTFANAKHCNTDYSNRIKLVNIYRARTDKGGGSFIGDTSGYGLGFRSSNIFDIKRRT